MMKVRKPRIDYSQVRPDWTPHREFAHDRNASSTVAPHMEPYLIKVMQQAKAVLPAKETELHREIDLFVAQESQHYRQHNAFNRTLREAGYFAIAPLEDKLKRDYAEFLERRPLKFNLAYSEGCESAGPPSATLLFEHCDSFLDGADPEAVALWKWHLAEEYEHREICHKLYHALYSRTPWQRVWNGWLYRVYGFIFAIGHLMRYNARVRQQLIDEDRRHMMPAEIAASKRRMKQVDALTRGHLLVPMLRVLSPFYNPARHRMPKGMDGYLERFEQAGGVTAARTLAAA